MPIGAHGPPTLVAPQHVEEGGRCQCFKTFSYELMNWPNMLECWSLGGLSSLF